MNKQSNAIAFRGIQVDEDVINTRFYASRASEAQAKARAEKEVAHKAAVRADFRGRLGEVMALGTCAVLVMIAAVQDLIAPVLAQSIAASLAGVAVFNVGKFVGRWGRR